MRKCLLFVLALGFSVTFTSATLAQTPDGQTPAEESVCDTEIGAAFGLCTAYCEAMDCDSDDPAASGKACSQVGRSFNRITGRMPPCESTCPCFEAADLLAIGSILECGEFPGFDDLIGVRYTDGVSSACSGINCANSEDYRACGTNIGGIVDTVILDISFEEDLACRATILQVCDAPLAPTSRRGKRDRQSVTPFLDQ